MVERVRLLHTSDVHIGEDGRSVERLEGLARVIDAAIALDVDVVLIAGDLYDSARVRSQDIEASFAQFGRISVPVCIIPGNHDCLESPSIYERIDLSRMGDNVRLLANPDGEAALITHLSLTVWARAMVSHTPLNNPLHGFSRGQDSVFNVVMAHGHYISSTFDHGRSSPIQPAHLAELSCDYVALGHWHHPADVSAPQTPAFYSGSPSSELDSQPSVNLVTLNPSAAVVQRVMLPCQASETNGLRDDFLLTLPPLH